MNTHISPATCALLGVVLLLAILAAGCAGSPPAAPQTPVPTAAPTEATIIPATTMVMTPVPTATETESPTTVAPTTPVPTPTAAPTPSLPPAVAIPIQNFGFNPQTVTVPVGTTVTWTNYDTVQHQISNSATTTIGPGLLFASPILGKGDSYSYTFTTAGAFQYYCVVHPYMIGTIFVK